VAHVRKGNRELIKRINRNLVLNVIKSRGPLSRTEIARLSGLSLATVSGITAEFIQTGLVNEQGEGESSGGRRPVLLVLNPQAGFVVGVKLMEHAVTSALTDLNAQVLHHRITPLPAPEGKWRPEGVLPTVIQAIGATIAEAGVDRRLVLGIGVGMAGLVDGEAGVCRYSPFFDWQDAEIAAPIADSLGLPVYLENDVNTLTIAEQWFGYGHGVQHFVVVTVGRGVGAGIVVNGQFYRGAMGGAGEFGHITLLEGGPPCDCGKQGCLEALASDQAMVRQARAAMALGERTTMAKVETLTLESIVAAAEAGDELARRLLADSGHWLGIGISMLVNVLNPQMVIVGGEGVRAGEWRFGSMRKAVRDHSFDGLINELQIVIEPSGDKTWARGAASLVLQEIYRSPIHAGGSELNPSAPAA
jgi:N-acetylglucosamine repressor